jgi:hypothetical protein
LLEDTIHTACGNCKTEHPLASFSVTIISTAESAVHVEGHTRLKEDRLNIRALHASP